MINNCDLEVELKDRNQTYNPGDTVSGTVHVEVSKDCRCDALNLSLEWFTHGRGNARSEIVDLQSLFQGDWTAGEHHAYDFETTVPPGPYTYHGNYLNVDWRVKAHADIPWALDPTAERELTLEPTGTEETFRPGEEHKAETVLAATDNDQTISWSDALIGSISLISGLGLIAFLRSTDQFLGALLLAVPFIGVGGLFVYLSVRNYFAEQRLGDVDVHLDPGDASPGETVRCRVEMEPPSTVTLNEVTVRLHGHEKVVSGSGTNETTYTHTVHDEETTISRSKQATIRSGRRTFRTSLALPSSAPFSFYARDNQMRWDVEVHVDVPNWPDWVHTDLVTVRPGARS